MKSGHREHKPVKKHSLTWKSRVLIYQSPSWKSKIERSKAGFDVYQIEFGKNKLDSMPRALERAKAKF